MKKYLPILLVLTGFLVIFLAYFPILKDEIRYQLDEVLGSSYKISTGKTQPDSEESVFASLLGSPVKVLTPVNEDFSVIIEKIGVNAPVVRDVPVSMENAYKKALRFGVAHSLLSPYPSDEAGNVYLFAHATTNFWDLGKYATIFNLLRKLEKGDLVHLYYEGKTYEYEVISKEVLPGWNTYSLTRPVIEPILTLQTCDPPGTTLNRLVVTSRLVRIY